MKLKEKTTTKTKIKFEVSRNTLNKLKRTLLRFNNLEIGGILIGYRIDINHFYIVDITIADDILKFSNSSFVREPFKSFKKLSRLFKLKRYSYIGEWHSHPSFSLYPSNGDINTINGILSDCNYNVSFVLLIIAKLVDQEVELMGFLFHNKLSKYVKANIVLI